ncbi:MAG TPA: AarF/ABC1/UbiB kinase family protein [Solirubrobacteraceae bacterium]|nr:AarF/ABC1/UbiB kinase family protein [Solirubrobacteraceae bacterium]
MKSRHRRQRQIAEVLVRHGLGYMVGALGLERFGTSSPGVPEESDTVPQRLRRVLEDLGPTFIKLGQILSTRADLLGPEYQAELAKLQDDAPPIAAHEVWEVMVLELGGKEETAFASFGLEPLAAASIGQAHAATLSDGTEVVVKVRRPGAVEQVTEDLEILRNLAAFASRRWQSAARYDLIGLADEFAETLRAELDYLAEGHNAERFATNFAGDSDVRIPKVFWETTTSRVITLERLYGMKVTDVAALGQAGIDRQELAQRAARLMAKMVFEDGFFHADPHPGNFFIESDGTIGLIDFGMVGVVDERLRDRLGRLMLALGEEDADRLADALLAIGAATGPVDRARLRDDLAQMLPRYSGRSLGEIELRQATGDILEILRRHRLTAPRDLALLLKSFVMNEGMAVDLDPDFRLVETLTPYAYRYMLARFSPGALARRAERVAVEMAELSADLPARLNRLLDVLTAGSFDVHLSAEDLEPHVRRLERLGNRIAASVIAAAMIDGLAELAAADRTHARGQRTLRRLAQVAGAGALIDYAASRRQRRRTSRTG